MRWIIIIGILSIAYVATAIETYTGPTTTDDPIHDGRGEFWLWAITWYNIQIPVASILAGPLIYLGLDIRRTLIHERKFREYQRKLGIETEN